MSHSLKAIATKPLSLVWLRRDLRLFDHAALAAASQAGHPTQPFFIFDTDILARFTNKDDRRLSLIAQALCRMHEKLRERGSGLLVLYGRAQEIVPALCRSLRCGSLFAAEDFEPQTRKRDAEMKSALAGETECIFVLDHLLHSPLQVLKGDGTPFKVFTPYAKAWRDKANSRSGFAAEAPMKDLSCADYALTLRILADKDFTLLEPSLGAEPMLTAIGDRLQRHDWPVDEARKRLHTFADERMAAYTTQRDFMGADGTSRISPYLRFGLVSARECARLAMEEEMGGSPGASTWLKELIWRDFYATILYHFPETATLEMQAQYRGIKWSHGGVLFDAFRQGLTGYPVVDAAMRELRDIGFMHNRARMITASFMTKDLLLDWRMGEEHFAQFLMDYDMASNVGGWQWAASTGTDAQPYFRIFNPVLQGRRFDPEGHYIRRFVPELAHLPADAMHEPWKSGCPEGYPNPVVNHAEMREKAIAMFKNSSAT
jgi:deoxyribodipyrimidine photo-lyase